MRLTDYKVNFFYLELLIGWDLLILLMMKDIEKGVTRQKA
jgi:hypothetical protein